MKRFVYKMQGILELKEKLEEQEKNNYSIAKVRLDEEEQRLQQIEDKKQYYEQMLRDSMQERLDIQRMKHLKEAIETLKQLIKQQNSVVQKAKQAVDVAMMRLNNAMSERKTQEKLKEKALEQYQTECRDEEKKEIDELVSFKHSQKESTPI